MISDASEAAIDQIVASCNGDIRGALKAACKSVLKYKFPYEEN